MDHLARIARSGTPDTGTLFRGSTYGKGGIRRFLRDVLSLANAQVEGSRYIIVGVDFDAKGRKQKHAIDGADFAGGIRGGDKSSGPVSPTLFRPSDVTIGPDGAIHLLLSSRSFVTAGRACAPCAFKARKPR